MKIIITESQYKKYKHLFEQSVYDDEDYDGCADENCAYHNVRDAKGRFMRKR
jgi:hypothetical protein